MRTNGLMTGSSTLADIPHYGPAEPWIPMTDPVEIAVVGKLGEEANELGKICSRSLIQGIDGVDPSSGKINRVALANEIADVFANAQMAMRRFNLDSDYIMMRCNAKMDHLKGWHEQL